MSIILGLSYQKGVTSSEITSSSNLTENKTFPVENVPLYWPVKENNRVQTVFGGFQSDLVVNWKQLVESMGEMTIMAPTGITQRAQFDWLASRGIKLSVIIFPFRGGYNMLDLYYNTSYQLEAYSLIERELEFTWLDLVYKIRLGDEEPLSSFAWGGWMWVDEWPEAITKYNNTYFTETSYYFKSLGKMSMREQRVFHSWLDTRSVAAMNLLRQYLREHYSDKLVDWGTIPLMGQTLGNLDVDERQLGIFTSDPAEVYSQVRNYKTMFPDVPLTTVLWGDLDPWADIPTNSRKDFELLTAAAVAAGSEKVAWFTNDWLSPDKASQAHFTELLEITRKISKLPVFKPRPRILEINNEFGLARKAAPGLAEFDCISQKAVLEFDLDLSPYHTIIVRDQYNLYEEVVQRLNRFVEQGGNLILVGNTGITLQNEWGDPRSNLLAIESPIISYRGFSGDVLTIKRDDNPLAFSYLSIESPSYNTINVPASSDYQIIPTGLPVETERYYPLVLYHQSTSPTSGWVLYSGFSVIEDEALWYKLLKRFLELKAQSLDGIALSASQSLWHGIGTFGRVQQTDQENIYSWLINLESTKESVTIQANFADRNWNHPVDWYYGNIEGLDNNMLWWGTNSPHNGQTQLSRMVGAKSLEHFLYTGTHPGPSLTLDVIEPLHQPIVGEPFFFILKITNELQFEDITNLDLQLSLPYGIEVIPLPNSPTQAELKGKETYIAIWNLKSTIYGIIPIELTIRTDGTLYRTNITIPLKIDRGRVRMTILEVSKINVPYSQNVTFHLSIYFETKDLDVLTDIYLDNIVLYMIWGNPGRTTSLQTIASNSRIKVTIQEPLSNLQLGNIGIWRFFLYSTAYPEIWTERHILLSVDLASSTTTIPITETTIPPTAPEFPMACPGIAIIILVIINGLARFYFIKRK